MTMNSAYVTKSNKILDTSKLIVTGVES